MSAQCWSSRREVDPRYDPASDQWGPDDCAHAVCAADLCPGFHDWDCVSVSCLYRRMDALCILDESHNEPHQFDDAVSTVIVFPEVATP